MFIRKSEGEIGAVKLAARDASNDAANVKRLAVMKETRFQEQTDGGIADLVVKGAKSGVATDYGFPLEYMSKVVDDRAEDYGLTKWENSNDVYARERAAANLFDKATIMLDEKNMQEQMFDYQASLFMRAAGDARRIARYKSYQAALNVG
jgi:methylthioribose-1-phosphate isomerase